MIAQMRTTVLIPRRQFLLIPLAVLSQVRVRGEPLAPAVERQLIATVERGEGLLPPLTLTRAEASEGVSLLGAAIEMAIVEHEAAEAAAQ